MQIDIDDLRELMAGNDKGSESPGDDHPYTVGANYIVRTVTMIYTGKLIEVWPHELVLLNAAWIPETERWMQFVEKGSVKECEPYPAGRRVVIGRGSLIDAMATDFELPRTQK